MEAARTMSGCMNVNLDMEGQKVIVINDAADPSVQGVTITHEFAHELLDHWPGIRDTNDKLEAELSAFF